VTASSANQGAAFAFHKSAPLAQAKGGRLTGENVNAPLKDGEEVVSFYNIVSISKALRQHHELQEKYSDRFCDVFYLNALR
jgi:hypothetical protein